MRLHVLQMSYKGTMLCWCHLYRLQREAVDDSNATQAPQSIIKPWWMWTKQVTVNDKTVLWKSPMSHGNTGFLRKYFRKDDTCALYFFIIEVKNKEPLLSWPDGCRQTVYFPSNPIVYFSWFGQGWVTGIHKLHSEPQLFKSCRYDARH